MGKDFSEGAFRSYPFYRTNESNLYHFIVIPHGRVDPIPTAISVSPLMSTGCCRLTTLAPWGMTVLLEQPFGKLHLPGALFGIGLFDLHWS